VQVFTARYRTKFLQLADVFLASSMVPAYSAAAFAKKFARLALVVPPSGALSCLAFAHNLIRRHPSCLCLIHKPGQEHCVDPFNDETTDLDESKGIESCLWELEALKKHVDSSVCCQAPSVVESCDCRLTALLRLKALQACCCFSGRQLRCRSGWRDLLCCVYRWPPWLQRLTEI
jgi:hypothetical protein